MNSETLLLRQVHPVFVQNGRVTSQAFKPTPKDGKKLSVYDGDLIQAGESHKHWTEELGYRSAGVLGVDVDECVSNDLPTSSDPEPFPEHAIIDFSEHGTSKIENKAKTLRNYALRRNWLFGPFKNS